MRQVRYEWFSFDGLRKSDEGSDTNLTYNFCWSYITTVTYDKWKHHK